MRFAAPAHPLPERHDPVPGAPHPMPGTGVARPSIHYHIERVVIEGIALTARQKQLLSAALEQELGRLLHAAPNSVAGLQGTALASLTAGPIKLCTPCDPHDLGQQIARSVHASVAPATGPASPAAPRSSDSLATRATP